MKTYYIAGAILGSDAFWQAIAKCQLFCVVHRGALLSLSCGDLAHGGVPQHG